MSIPPIERAIALIEQGRRIKAQKLLKQLITEDQHNLDAWFWLVETCPTNKQRLNILEMCLEHNPDNEQVKQELEKLRRLPPAQLSATLPKYENERSLNKREWLLSCLFGTLVTIFLMIFVPFGQLLMYPLFYFVTETLAFVIAGLYFGIVFALIFSKDRRQIFAAIALIAVYIHQIYWRLSMMPLD